MSPASPLDLAYMALHQFQQVLAEARHAYDQRLEENPQIRERLFAAGIALNMIEELQAEVSMEAYANAYHEYHEANEDYDIFMSDAGLAIRNAALNVRRTHQTIRDLQANTL